MLSQKEAVYQFVCMIVDVVAGTPAELTDAEFAELVTQLADGFEADEIGLSPKAKVKYDTREKLEGYCRALIKNHMKKDTRLTGGVKYVPENKGTRKAKITDPQLKALTDLRAQVEDTHPSVGELDTAISERRAELASESMTKIDWDSIPADLAAAFQPASEEEESNVESDPIAHNLNDNSY